MTAPPQKRPPSTSILAATLVVASTVGAHAAAAPNATQPSNSAPPSNLRTPAAPGAEARAFAVRENSACESCHEDVAREWRQSMHAKAHTDPMYQRAFAREPLAFCRSCHAPEAAPDRDVPEALGAIGVGCITCHVADRPSTAGTVLGSKGPPGAGSAASVGAPHAVLRDARMSTAAACAGCHEFDFPSAERRSHPDKMQLTVSEHAASPFAAKSCQTCHMPNVETPSKAGSHKSHDFRASRDPSMLAKAVRVRAERATAQHVRLVLEPGDVGHAFPTGDLFRRLVVLVVAGGDAAASDGAVSANGRVIARRVLTRRFREVPIAPGTSLRIPTGDDRVGAPGAPLARTVEFQLPETARNQSVEWRVVYERAEFPATVAPSAAVEERIVVASGILPAGERDTRTSTAGARIAPPATPAATGATRVAGATLDAKRSS